jgi:hypothetical protein
MHLPWSPGTTSDDRIASSVETLIGKQIVFTEKLDGENSGIEKKAVYARSHAAPTISPWSRMVRELHSLIKNDIEPDMFLFGENMEGIHSIEYENLESPFYLFGIRQESRWFSWKEVEEYAYLLGIPTVPVLYKGIVNTSKELEDLTNSLVHQPSALGGKREGIVVRVADSFEDEDFATSVMKWVRKGHVTTDAHWTKKWKRAKIQSKL